MWYNYNIQIQTHKEDYAMAIISQNHKENKELNDTSLLLCIMQKTLLLLWLQNRLIIIDKVYE